jgi:hypothetical protein
LYVYISLDGDWTFELRAGYWHDLPLYKLPPGNPALIACRLINGWIYFLFVKHGDLHTASEDWLLVF